MSSSAALDKTPSADEFLMKCVIIQFLEQGTININYEKLAQQLSLTNAKFAGKRWSRLTLKIKKEAEDIGRPIATPDNSKQATGSTPKKRKAAPKAGYNDVEDSGGATKKAKVESDVEEED